MSEPVMGAADAALPAAGTDLSEQRAAQAAIRALVDYLAAKATVGPPPHRLDALTGVAVTRSIAMASAKTFLSVCDINNQMQGADDQ